MDGNIFRLVEMAEDVETGEGGNVKIIKVERCFEDMPGRELKQKVCPMCKWNVTSLKIEPYWQQISICGMSGGVLQGDGTIPADCPLEDANKKVEDACMGKEVLKYREYTKDKLIVNSDGTTLWVATDGPPERMTDDKQEITREDFKAGRKA